MIQLTIAFLATIVTSIQSILLYLGGNGICFNDGCAVVESLTTVSPLIFNIAGMLFFQSVFWALFFARHGSKLWQQISQTLLHAALGAEAVLIFFQWRIAEIFCSYCLIIFACIFLLNLLLGLRQIVTGIAIFCAVLVACFGLHWQNANQQKSLDDGTLAFVVGEKSSIGGGYLFFSENCKHCESVIDWLRKDNSCEIRFNPVDKITHFSFSGAEITSTHNFQVNRDFLKLLSIKEIPVFITKSSPVVRILSGESQIIQYLQEACRAPKRGDYSGSSNVESGKSFLREGKGMGEDGCSVAEECDKILSLEQQTAEGRLPK